MAVAQRSEDVTVRLRLRNRKKRPAARLAWPKLARGERRLAERVGFEPTCPLRDKTLSRRPRYDHFGTSPGGGRRPRRAAGTHVAAAGAARTKHYNAGPYPFPSREVIADDTRVTRPAARISAGRGAQSHAEADARRVVLPERGVQPVRAAPAGVAPRPSECRRRSGDRRRYRARRGSAGAVEKSGPVVPYTHETYKCCD